MKLKIRPVWFAVPCLAFAPLSQGSGKDPAAEGRRLRAAEESAQSTFAQVCAAQAKIDISPLSCILLFV